MEEVEIISIYERCNKTGAKAGAKAHVKASANSSRSKYYLFLREQFDKMAREDRKTTAVLYQEEGRRLRKIVQG